jgi:hypothetical protein
MVTAVELLDEEIDWSIFSEKCPETALVIEKVMVKFAIGHCLEQKQAITEAILNNKSLVNIYPLENIK